MLRELQVTADGSHTITLPGTPLAYHSLHGAVQESMHVFIKAGLTPLLPKSSAMRIFEMGFGTGLNALLSLKKALEGGGYIYYTAVELYPLTPPEYTTLNYCSLLQQPGLQPYFIQMHSAPWDDVIFIHPMFTLHKIKASLTSITLQEEFDLIFFDAFAPEDQPELWTEAIFAKMYAMLADSGVLVTYSAKGSVRRALMTAGFIVEKLPGPPGKREIIRAVKPSTNNTTNQAI